MIELGGGTAESGRKLKFSVGFLEAEVPVSDLPVAVSINNYSL